MRLPTASDVQVNITLRPYKGHEPEDCFVAFLLFLLFRGLVLWWDGTSKHFSLRTSFLVISFSVMLILHFQGEIFHIEEHQWTHTSNHPVLPSIMWQDSIKIHFKTHAVMHDT